MATFESPDVSLKYFTWAKLFDAGTFVWIVLYKNIRGEIRSVIKRIIPFSFLRLAWEWVSYFTGLEINYEWGVAALFLGLVSVLSIICIIQFRKIEKHL